MTALSATLLARKVSVDRLLLAGFAQSRADELYAGAEPSIDEVRAISRALRLPVRELLINYEGAPKGETKLRTNFGRDISTELELEALQATDRARALGDFISQSGLPVFKDFPKTAATAEELAVIVRRNLLSCDDESPLGDLSKLFYDKLGVTTIVTHFRSIEGASSRASHAAIVLLASRPSTRMRFTFSHEICHLLVDLESDRDEVWLDEFVMAPRQESNFLEEAFANSFASALLLPARGVAKVLRDFREAHGAPQSGMSSPEIMALARQFRVSFLVAAIRLEGLELLPEGGAQMLQSALTKEYGSPEKFAASLGFTEPDAVDWKYSARKLFEDFCTNFDSGDYSLEYMSGISGLTVREAMSAYYGRSYN